MPIYKTSTSALDKSEPVEVVLEIPSFAGGENTIGEDQELKVNEARVIENWDSISVGGMIRSKGFSSEAITPWTRSAAVFTGSGLNDATSSGTYTGTATATYTVIIDSSVASPDTFKWKKDSGSFTTGVSITAGSAQTLSDGIKITFAAGDGHTLNDQWVITVTVHTQAPDLLLHHFEGSSTRNYALINGHLFYVNGASLTPTDTSAFTAGTLSHGVSAGSKAWITNSTDNLKYTTISGSITTPTTQPAQACDRIYYHKSRLIAEGNSLNRVYGSKAGTGNWAGAGGWSASGDAWNIDLPDLTQGCVPNFPDGNSITVFTKHRAYNLYNFPNVAYRPVYGSPGCSAPYSIAEGKEGVFYVSQYPTLGVFLWDRAGNYINLTINEDWVDDINFSYRIFGIYREGEYILSYTSIAGGGTTPNIMRIYDSNFGRWMKRSINPSVADNFGYPAVIVKPSNQILIASSQQAVVYDFEDTSDSDNGYATVANYKTKDFTSKDFKTITGYSFPIDEVRIKLLKATVTYYGTTGNFTIQWTSDRGLHSGSQTYTMSGTGATLNTTFTLNSSYLSTTSQDKTTTKSFANNAIGRRFSFQILNSATGDRPKIKKIKLFGLALEEA